MNSIDETDSKVLQILREDARTPFVVIGKKVGLSESAVRRRVKNLVDSGVVRKFTVEIDRSQGARAVTLVALNPSLPTEEVSKNLKDVKGVEVIYEITGQYDIMVFMGAPTIADINQCIDDIRRINGIRETNTVIILKTVR